MALLKSHYIDHFDTTFTGAYHKIVEVNLETKAEPVPSGEQDDDPENNTMRINYQYNTFPSLIAACTRRRPYDCSVH